MTPHEPDERPQGAAGPAPDDGPADPALDRLRAADPAGDATADRGAIEAALRERVPDAFGAEPEPEPATVAAAGAEPAPVVELPVVADELAARRARRLPLQVAAAVAGVLVVGAGGYALGAGALGPAASSADAGSTVATALAPIELGGAPSEQSESAADAAAPTLETLGSGARASADMASSGFWGGRSVFHQEGLPTAGGSAEAWAYDAAGVFSKETARRVADALGVEGDVREEYGSYAVGSADWTGPSVSLQPDGLASVSYNDPAKDPWGCVLATPTEEGGGDTGADPADCREPELGAPPAADAAVDALRGTLDDLGVDLGGYEVVADEQGLDGDAPRTTTVSAYEVVDGRRTGTSWSATYSGAGLSSLYGGLAPRVALGTYDVVSPAEAVERLGDPRFASGGPVAWARDGVEILPEIGPAPEEEATPTVPPTVAEGSAFAWPVQDVTITDAQLGSAVQYQPDGAAVLVPAYELTDEDGSTWSVVAVVDDRLDFSAAP